jgi:excisionase family DNA binding protein
MNTQPAKNDPNRSLPSLEALRNGPPTLSVEEAARDYLGVSRPFAYQMAREGRLPVIHVGAKRIRVPALGLLKMLEEW